MNLRDSDHGRLEVLVTGDLFIWAMPNCGNPQKVQRFPRDWAAALREMATSALTGAPTTLASPNRHYVI